MANTLLGFISVLFTFIFLTLSTPYNPVHDFPRSRTGHASPSTHERERVLLLTAHPDDECMFFAPTLLGLTRVTSVQGRNFEEVEALAGENEPRADVYSLCLSLGDADGLGETRKRELEGSLNILGVKAGRRWVLDEPFHDNITLFWDAELIAEHVKPFLEENKIGIILTFDDRGISSHPNHISLERGVRTLLTNSPSKGLRAFSLKTTALLPKYTGAGAALFAKLEEAFCSAFPKLPFLHSLSLQLLPSFLGVPRAMDCTTYDWEGGSRALFVSGWSEYATALRAMRSHRSQLVWFRWLYVTFSRYMWVNEWEEIDVNPD